VIKTKRKTKILSVVVIVVIFCIILLSIFVIPSIGYYRISKGMTELEVKNILGEPKYDSEWNMSEPFFGYHPNLPNNMTFRALNYFINDQIVIIILVSSSDYSKLTGKNIEDNFWRVVEKNIQSASIVY
jgi:hypothetical protein